MRRGSMTRCGFVFFLRGFLRVWIGRENRKAEREERKTHVASSSSLGPPKTKTPKKQNSDLWPSRVRALGPVRKAPRRHRPADGPHGREAHQHHRLGAQRGAALLPRGADGLRGGDGAAREGGQQRRCSCGGSGGGDSGGSASGCRDRAASSRVLVSAASAAVAVSALPHPQSRLKKELLFLQTLSCLFSRSLPFPFSPSAKPETPTRALSSAWCSLAHAKSKQKLLQSFQVLTREKNVSLSLFLSLFFISRRRRRSGLL